MKVFDVVSLPSGENLFVEVADCLPRAQCSKCSGLGHVTEYDFLEPGDVQARLSSPSAKRDALGRIKNGGFVVSPRIALCPVCNADVRSDQ